VAGSRRNVRTSGLDDRGVQPDVFERLRLAGMNLGAIGDHRQDDLSRFRPSVDDDHLDVVRTERLGDALQAFAVRH
jgi:hypothetical protein